jgi:hypothetical protein
MPWQVPPKRRKQLQDLEQVNPQSHGVRLAWSCFTAGLQMLQEQEELLLGGPAGSGPGSMLSLNALNAKTKKLPQALCTHGALHPTLGALMLHVGAGGCACPLCQEMGEELSNAFPTACECVCLSAWGLVTAAAGQKRSVRLTKLPTQQLTAQRTGQTCLVCCTCICST